MVCLFAFFLFFGGFFFFFGIAFVVAVFFLSFFLELHIFYLVSFAVPHEMWALL